MAGCSSKQYHTGMLAADLMLVDIDGVDWANWFDLLVPPRMREDPRFALVFIDEGKLCKAVVRGKGALAPDSVPFTGTSRPELRSLARHLGVATLIVAERNAMAELHAAIDRNLDLHADFVAQVLVIVRALKALSGKKIWTEPALLDVVPPLSYDALQRTFDLLIPDRSSMAAYVFEGRALHASMIAVKRNGHIDFATTHLGVEDALDRRTLASNWQKHYKELLQIIAERHERPSLGVFMERAAFHRIAAGPPDQLARELDARQVIIDPAPAWLMALLGGATVAAAAGRGARALARMLPSPARQMASNLAQTAQSMMREHSAYPFALLGFDPIELWLGIRHLYRER